MRARGATATLAFGPSRRFSGAGEARVEPFGVEDFGVCVVEFAFETAVLSPSSSSSSTPNESFPFATGFCFFFGDSMGVLTLHFDH